METAGSSVSYATYSLMVKLDSTLETLKGPNRLQGPKEDPTRITSHEASMQSLLEQINGLTGWASWPKIAEVDTLLVQVEDTAWDEELFCASITAAQKASNK